MSQEDARVLTEPFCDNMHGLAMVEQPGSMRPLQVVQANAEAEDFRGSLGELLRDAVRVSRFVRLTVRRREDQPILREADKAQIDVGALRSPSDESLIGLAHSEQHGDQGVIDYDRPFTAFAFGDLEPEPEFLGVLEARSMRSFLYAASKSAHLKAQVRAQS
jgi:hypothetical protein